MSSWISIHELWIVIHQQWPPGIKMISQHVQGCHLPFWDRVQGHMKWGNYWYFGEIGKNFTNFNWRTKLIFSCKFTAIWKNLCSLSLRSINFWTAFKKLVWGSKFKYNLGIFRSHIVKIHQFWHSKWGHFTAKFWGECRSWCVMHQGVEVKFCYALCIIETLLNDHIWWISPMW